MKKYLLFMFCLIVIISFSGCGDDNSVDNTGSGKSFKIILNNDFGDELEKVFVVLHSKNNQADVIKTATSKSNIDFGIVDDTISFTIIARYHKKQQDIYTVSVKTFLNVCPGSWNFSLNNQNTINTASITMKFPEKTYSYSYLSFCEGNIKWLDNSIGGLVSESVITKQADLNSNNKLNIYAFAHSQLLQVGFCGWQLDKNFTLNSIDSYELDCSIPMTRKILQTSLRASHISLSGLYNNNYLPLFYHEESTSSQNHIIYYPETFPADKYKITCSNTKEVDTYSYYETTSTIPTNISIPNTSINANINTATKEVTDITCSGSQVDNIELYMYYNINNKNIITWTISTNNNSKKITLPTLPKEITEEIDFDYKNIQYNLASISIIDFDISKDYHEYMDLVYKQSSSKLLTINKSYKYTKKL